MNKIQYHSNEFFLLRDFPEEPKIRTVKLYVDYEKSVEACIAAKTRIDNPELLNLTERVIKGVAYYYRGGMSVSLKDGDIFDLPSNVELEEHEVIHLKLKQEVKKCPTCGSAEGKILYCSNSFHLEVRIHPEQ